MTFIGQGRTLGTSREFENHVENVSECGEVSVLPRCVVDSLSMSVSSPFPL
jgi:hypothetical protein